MKIRYPDICTVYTEEETERFGRSDICSAKFDDVSLKLNLTEDSVNVCISADTTPLKYIKLRFNFSPDEKRSDPIHIFGDEYERGYSNMRWAGIEPERTMPWYMLISNGSDRCTDYTGRFTEGFGVKVQCGSIVTWQYDASGITMWADIRNGGSGVILSGRTLEVCDIVFGEYRDVSAFDAGRAFCRLMCPTFKDAGHKVYGSNNWYYAYGKSSHEEILGDTEIVADQCKGLENIPYMVIDDGWQKNTCDAPWTYGNEKFPDMKKLASEMRSRGVRPGIWIRFLSDEHREIPESTPEWRLEREPGMLDPSHPGVIDYVKRITRLLREWGFELIKHDYSTRDIFGKYYFKMWDQMTEDGWHFYDKSRTSAEIVLDFYRAVRDAAGDDCVIIGCNTVSHLCAGMYELNRTGNDTSGFRWSATRAMGVNTLAFRLMQNGIFYMADADCVGITGQIPWSLNRLWLDALARSGSPLFVSCKPGVLNESELAELKSAWAVNSVQKNECKPLDWMENEYPEVWLIDGEEVRYNWYDDDGITSFDPGNK